jgi:sigma-B regulation protein RsbU (phosphoserine phosphatase)
MIEVIKENRSKLAVHGLECSGYSLPAGQVGGDFFEFISINDRIVYTAIGDVMGKGFQAACLMEKIRKLLRDCINVNPHPLEVVRRLNKLGGHELRKFRSFTTLCLLCFDVVARRLTCVNAGHHPPLLLSGGRINVAECRGVALGLLEDYLGSGMDEYFLAAGDVVVLYTDGVVEACGPDEQRYGQERLKEVVCLNHGFDAERIRTNILADLDKFTKGIPQRDDVTLVVMKLTEKAGDRGGD